MKAENYLYFAKDGDNDAAQDCLMFPASNFRGAVTMSSATTEFFFDPMDGTGTTAAGILMTHADIKASSTEADPVYADASNGHFTVMEKFAQLASGNRNNTNNFTVIKDLNGGLPSNEGAISSSGISDVTAITVTMTE
jgi:hypothetical protein